MRAFLSAFWSTLIAILKGVNEYAETFESSGRVCKKTIHQFEQELDAESEIRAVKFQAQLQEQRAALAIEAK